MASTPPDKFSSVILTLGAGLLLYSGASIAVTWAQQTFLRRSSTSDRDPSAPPSKSWQESTVTVSYPTDPSMCQYPSAAAPPTGDGQPSRPLLLAGALLRLIDVVAGVAARRHAGQGCVTVSLDSVLFLSPIYLGDLVSKPPLGRLMDEMER